MKDPDRKKIVFILLFIFYPLSYLSLFAQETVGIKDVLSDKFLIGTALNERQISGKDTAAIRLVKQHFNAITAENCMKSGVLQPEEGMYNFIPADRFVAFGELHGLFITGHTLIWHSQLPEWFCIDKNGMNVTPEVLKERMRNYISTVVGRYKGRINGWDVVNEAIEDNGSYRKSKFYEILGEEYILLAFQYAHEADPEAKLYYNDYSMAVPAKRDAVVRLVKKIKEKGLQIDGIGMQGHIGLHYPAVEEFEKSIEAFSGTGVEVMITELDLSILPDPWQQLGAEITTRFDYREEMDPYRSAIPAEKQQEWNQRMYAFFTLFLKHADKISRVTLWGVTDGDSWKNNWPIKGRTDYPLLFDRNYQPKPVVRWLIENG